MVTTGSRTGVAARGALLGLALLPLACMAPPSELDAGLDAGPLDAGDSDGAPADTGAPPDALQDAARPDISQGLDAVGQTAKLEIATWNIQDFPRADDVTVSRLAGVLHDLQLDLIAVQEITAMRDFQRVVDGLPGYAGLLCTDTYANGTYQKTGLIYRSSQIRVANGHELFDDDKYAFPRSPLQVDVTATDAQGGGAYAFTLIVLHLKAGTTSDDYNSRLQALEKLKTHLDTERAAAPGRDFVMVGDFNAQLTGSSNEVWDPFVNDSANYRILTRPLVNAGEWSLPAYHIFIDHLVVADGTSADFASDVTRVLHLEEQLDSYTTELSDHRPVVTIIEPLAWR
jgi:endonuclease/exonuclease/phosphatase family metal-dependent hydrolase